MTGQDAVGLGETMEDAENGNAEQKNKENAEARQRKIQKGDILRLYAVTDRAWVGERTLEEQVEEALKGGVTALQLREKKLSYMEFREEAIRIHRLCRRYGVPLIINDAVELAVEIGAEGVHVGQEDMDAGAVREKIGEDMLLGVSIHSPEEAVRAESAGADYLGIGAVFPTGTKQDVSVLSETEQRRITAAAKLPSVAIGGICEENIPVLSGRGFSGVALVSAIFGAKEIRTQCRRLRELSDQLRTV